MIVLNKYEIIEEVGRGGMGVVYRATDVRLGRAVAIKELVISDAIIGQERDDIIARFQREAQTAANLNHPNIITVFDVGDENNRHFIAMEYLPGKTLKDYLDEGHEYTLEELVEILIQIGVGLDHAHSRGVVHRDIKPGNMKILEDNSVKIMDFGVARIESSSSTTLTQDGTMLGTLGYISPEQLHNSKGVDSRADIFSYGAMMYEIFTKKLPFDGGTVGSTILKIMTENPVSPKKINPEVPETIEKIIIKCLQKDPDKRYQKLKEVVQELMMFKMLLSTSPDFALHGSQLQPDTHKALPEKRGKEDFIPEIIPREDKQEFLKVEPVVQSFAPPSPPAQTPVFQPNKTLTAPGIAIPKKPAPPSTEFISSPIPDAFEQKVSPKSDPFKTSSPGEIRNEPSREARPFFPGMLSSPGIPKPSQPQEQQSGDIRIAFVRIIGKMGTAKGQFSSPRGIAVSNLGIVLVADTQNRRVQAFDSLGTWQYLIQSSEMQSPCDVAIDNTGKVYIIDSMDCKIRVFDSSGNIISRFGGKGTGNGQFRSAAGIAIGHDRVYVTDTEGYKVQVFGLNGQIQTIFGKYGTRPGEYKSPYGIALDDSRIFILDYGIPRVQVIDKDGISRLVFGQRGTSKGEFSIPKGIGVDKFGRVYVADTLNHRIQIFDRQGKWLYSFGSKGTGQGQFTGPEGIVISNDGTIFVLDKGNNRVQVFTYDI